MNEPKFTPGPYKVICPVINGVQEENYLMIQAGCGYCTDTTPDSGFGLTGCINQANANLLASAPDLYEQLEKTISAAKAALQLAFEISEKPIVTDAEADYRIDEAKMIEMQVDKAEAVLAKARGEQ